MGRAGLWAGLIALSTVALLVRVAPAPAAEPPAVAFERAAGEMKITVGGSPLGTYVFRDDVIGRPYFAHLRAPGGVQATRTHPPVEGQDATDHATFHPGLWLAFGDLSGADDWRNRARVEHVRFVEEPKASAGRGSFVVENRYLPATGAGGSPLCREVCSYAILVRPAGYLLICDSTFRSDTADFYFGDQEEMGFGVRVASPLAVVKGGKIRNSDGLVNEPQVWGKAADWCDYSGSLGGKRVGITLMPDPHNFRRSWFHARDYGLLVANPFGRNAMTSGAPSRVLVKRGETLRLRFGVLLHTSAQDEPLDLAVAYRDFLAQLPPEAARPREPAQSHRAFPAH